MPIRINFVGSSPTECTLVGTFFCLNDYRKARERELLLLTVATFDENRRPVAPVVQVLIVRAGLIEGKINGKKKRNKTNRLSFFAKNSRLSPKAGSYAFFFEVII